jgi:D-serine deaminase-like pyridoxal phosphate-dependent protein
MKITRPTLLLDKQKCVNNIEQMASKAAKHNLIFRPHFKTHQSTEIGNWFRNFGVNKITVSSVQMANYFAEAGWKDITIAFPFNQLEIDEINDLATKIDLNVLVIHPESVEFLGKDLKNEIGVFIKIDCGYHRTGILAESTNEIDVLINKISEVEKLKFKGFLTHSGHTYQADSVKRILEIHETTKQKMVALKERYKSQFNDIFISVGDTPSCSLAEDFSGIDEIRPGNFVFYDVMQLKLDVCKPDQISVAIACPIVAKNPMRNEITIYGGGVHLSKEFVLNNDSTKNFGLVIKLTKNDWSPPIEGIHVSSLSQEHGTLKVPSENFDQFNIGDVIGILPIHSCMTANLMGEYLTLAGDVLEHL